jgi:hypothetical protein
MQTNSHTKMGKLYNCLFLIGETLVNPLELPSFLQSPPQSSKSFNLTENFNRGVRLQKLKITKIPSIYLFIIKKGMVNFVML